MVTSTFSLTFWDFHLGKLKKKSSHRGYCILIIYIKCWYYKNNIWLGFPYGTVVKNLPADTRDIKDVGSIPGSERSPGVGNDNALQYSCLGNPMDRVAWQATVHGITKRQTQLSNFPHKIYNHWRNFRKHTKENKKKQTTRVTRGNSEKKDWHPIFSHSIAGKYFMT